MFLNTRSSQTSNHNDNSNDTATLDSRNEAIDFIVRDIDRLYDQVTALGSPRSEPVRSLAAAGTILREDLNHISKIQSATLRHLTPTSREILGVALNELGIELPTEK